MLLAGIDEKVKIAAIIANAGSHRRGELDVFVMGAILPKATFSPI
jgi:hypothetical protein